MFLTQRIGLTRRSILACEGCAIAAVPQALVMLYGAFNPTVIARVPGLRIAIAFGGLSLLWIALKAFSAEEEGQSEKATALKTRSDSENPSTQL